VAFEGLQGKVFHAERVKGLAVEALDADERRHGYTTDKGQRKWEAEVIDPHSKFVLSHVQGRRDEALVRRLLEDSAARRSNRHAWVLFTAGAASDESLFGAIVGVPYRVSRKGCRGRFPDVRYRIPRPLAHVQSVKHRQGSRVVRVDIRFAPGSKRRVQRALIRQAQHQRR